MYIDNPSYFGDHYFDENGDDAIRDKYRSDVVFVFKCAVNNSLQASLVQYRYQYIPIRIQ